MDPVHDHHEHYSLGEVIADSLRRSGIASAEEADAFVVAWWEALDRDRREAESEAGRG